MDANIDLYAGEAAREKRSKSLFGIAGLNIYDRTGERASKRETERENGRGRRVEDDAKGGGSQRDAEYPNSRYSSLYRLHHGTRVDVFASD